MCRSIKTLRRPAEPATDDEIRAAALQFVRKVSGYRTPSSANEAVFDAVVGEIAASSQRLLASLRTGARVSHKTVIAGTAAMLLQGRTEYALGLDGPAPGPLQRKGGRDDR